jgi:hypothetical protein
VVIRVEGFFKNGSRGNKSLLTLWGALLGVDKKCSGADWYFFWRARFVFHFHLLCRVACEGRGARAGVLVLPTGEGECVNPRLLLLLRFCSVVPFLSSLF